MGFIEPVIILGVMLGLYGATRALPWHVKRRLLWWLVAALLAFGALGAGYSLLRDGSLPAPPFED